MNCPSEKFELNPSQARAWRSQNNRRGRKNPARVPAKLTRTAAFLPKRQGLITDRKFEKSYAVPGGSVISLRGGELGSQHRDVLYAVMRKPAVVSQAQSVPFNDAYYRVTTSWRELITSMKNIPHQANLRTLLNLLEDLKQVTIRVEQGTYEEVMEAKERGDLAGAGHSTSVIHDIYWTGKALDDELCVVYGGYVKEAIESKHLVSLNAEVQFKLKNDHAKSFWPWIDSQNHHRWIDEDRLAALAGRHLWSQNENSKTRNNFRVTCKKAFEDMIQAGGLVKFTVEVRGVGRKKSRRYHYEHALARQIEQDMDQAAKDVDEIFLE